MSQFVLRGIEASSRRLIRPLAAQAAEEWEEAALIIIILFLIISFLFYFRLFYFFCFDVLQLFFRWAARWWQVALSILVGVLVRVVWEHGILEVVLVEDDVGAGLAANFERAVVYAEAHAILLLMAVFIYCFTVH